MASDSGKSREDADPVVEFARVRAELDVLRAEQERLTSGAVGGTDLVPTRSADPVIAKRQLAAVRAQAKKTMTAVAAKHKELERMMKAELQRAAELLAPMQELVEELEQAVTTINLYLGKEEQLVLLRDGQSAPESETITLRQMLLFMDEEMGAEAEQGGIMPVDFELFDKWLLEDPAHLDQVLPETKGVVALRPRRKRHRAWEREWSDADAKANKRTYWLVRNGERLYRVTTELETEERILPLSDEVERLFSRMKGGKRVPLTPGSHEWEQAQKSAKEQERCYMRVALVLEGLLHRTPAFHPLPPQGVSFLAREDIRAGRVRYITDAEGLLGTGRESFKEWRSRLAGELRPGMRIILGPGIERYDHKERRGNSRLHPEIATRPHVGVVYTVEERRAGGDLIFRYHEGERRVAGGSWGYGEVREPKRRASCTIRPTDEFVLPFDLATVDEMRAFLHSRTDRHQYAAMFPVLKTAIAAKRREAEVEQPFRTMLAGVLAREHGVQVAEAELAIPDLVAWWKLRNKFHRPLLLEAGRPAEDEDDEPGRRASAKRAERESAELAAKAVRMIVAEHKRRLKDAERGADPEIVARLRAAHTDALAIARPRRAGYLVLDPAEPTKNVYVHETEYTAGGELKSRREWVQPGVTRPKQWLMVHSTERWARWDVVADEREHLRGPEIEQMTAQVIKELSGDERALALAWDNDKKFTVWRADAKGVVIDPEHPLTREQKPPSLTYRERGWKRVSGAVALRNWSYEHDAHARHDESLPWDEREWRSAFDDEDDAPRALRHHVIWRNEPALARLTAERSRHLKVSAREDELADRVNALVDSVKAEWLERAWAVERARFDEDFGDEDLWEAHKRSKEKLIRFPHEGELGHRYKRGGAPNKLWDAVALLVERGEDPEGRTVADVLDEARARFGAQEAAHHRKWPDERKRYTYDVPDELLGYVLRVREQEPKNDEETLDED